MSSLVHNESAAFETLHVPTVEIIDCIRQIFQIEWNKGRSITVVLEKKIMFPAIALFSLLGKLTAFDHLIGKTNRTKVKCLTEQKNTNVFIVLNVFSDRGLISQPIQHRSLNWSFNWPRRNNIGTYNTYLHAEATALQEDHTSIYVFALTYWIASSQSKLRFMCKMSA